MIRRFATILGLFLVCSCEKPPTTDAGKSSPPTTPPTDVEASPPPDAKSADSKSAEAIKPEPAKDCLDRPTATPATLTWNKVGTSKSDLQIFGMENAVAVAAGKRTYIVAAGEELRDDPARRAGLKTPVAWALGRWPDDAWVVTDQGVDPKAEGSAPEPDLFVWQWKGERWERPVRKLINDDPETAMRSFLWRPGEFLTAACNNGKITFDRYSAGDAATPALSFPNDTYFCPRMYHLPGRNELLGADSPDRPQRSSTPRTSRWCATCTEPKIEPFTTRRCGVDPIDGVLVGLQAAHRGDRVAVDVSTSRRVPGGGASTHADEYVLLVDGESQRVDLVPTDGGVDWLSIAPGGDLWVAADDKLLRRRVDGTWADVALPADAKELLQVVALGDDDIWIVSAATSDHGSPRALHRTGAQAAALVLDTGKAK